MRGLGLGLCVLALLMGASSALAQEESPPPAPPPGPVVEEEVPPAAEGDGLDRLRAEHRSAKKAVVMSLVFPGWGQLYADSPFWSVVGFGAQMWYLGHILLEQRRMERQRVLRDREPFEEDGTLSATRELRDQLVTEHRERARDFVWWSSGAALLLALDAFVSVELADFDSNDPPTPDLDRDWPEDPGDGGGLALRLSFPF